MIDGSGISVNSIRYTGSIRQRSKFQYATKRVLDICAALAGLFFLSPVMLVISMAIRLHDGGPAVFYHTRIGKDGRHFKCFKFRTMVVNAEQRLIDLLKSDSEAAAEWARDQKLRRDPRVTALGRFLRNSSLDELPQLINILLGEMSLVGPRPIVFDEVVRYGDLFMAYKAVKPGVTGLWQVSGRNNVSYCERVAMDARYAATWTVVGDIGIILRTIPVVIASRGAA